MSTWSFLTPPVLLNRTPFSNITAAVVVAPDGRSVLRATDDVRVLDARLLRWQLDTTEPVEMMSLPWRATTMVLEADGRQLLLANGEHGLNHGVRPGHRSHLGPLPPQPLGVPLA